MIYRLTGIYQYVVEPIYRSCWDLVCKLEPKYRSYGSKGLITKLTVFTNQFETKTLDSGLKPRLNTWNQAQDIRDNNFKLRSQGQHQNRNTHISKSSTKSRHQDCGLRSQDQDPNT